MTTLPLPIQVARPTTQFTNGAPYTHVQFQWKAPTGEWVNESYSPSQEQLAARAPAGSPTGYWSDAEVEADVLQRLADKYGITNTVFAPPEPPQPEVPVAKTTLQQAAEQQATGSPTT